MTKFGPGGFIEPDGENNTTRPGCGVRGYCPTHDGRVIAIRDGKPKDVTAEAIAARLPDLDDRTEGEDQ